MSAPRHPPRAAAGYPLCSRWPRRFLIVALVGSLGVLSGAEDPLSEPFARRSTAAGSTLFTLLPPEQTGVVTENNYADPRMWGEKYQEFALGGMGTGVAVGDYDQDGRPDIFVVSKTGQNRLFRNLGGWRFEDVTAAAGIVPASGLIDQGISWIRSQFGQEPPADDVSIWKQGAAFADIDNDGWLDLYVCRFGAPNLLYRNQGNGTFRDEAQARGLAIVDASGMGAFADYDRDGWLDVYVQTNMLNAAAQPGGRRDYLLRNRGDGTFEDVTERARIRGDTLAHSVTWWDYDADGWPDIYVANDFAAPDRLYRNNGDGTFTDVIHQVVPRMPYSAMGADLGDINNDGLIDVTVADMATTTHVKDQRGMASARELNREDSDSPTQSPQVLYSTVYLNTGVGRMREAAFLTGLQATDWTWSVRFEDLDNDGRLDLHVTNGMNREYQNADMRDRILASESMAERLRIVKSSPRLNERNLAYRNLGDLRFEDVSAAWGLDQEGVSFGAAFGDFDGDGDLDLVYANYDAGASVLRNDSPDGHRVVIALRGQTSNRFGVGAVVRLQTAAGVQVRQLVLARGYLSTSEPALHFGLGEQEEIQRLTVEWPSGHRQEFAGLAANRRYQIQEPTGPAERRSPLPPAPPLLEDVSAAKGLTLRSRESFEPEQQALMPMRFDRRGPALAVGDLDGDGRNDLVLGGTSNQPAQVHLNNGRRFEPAGELAAGEVDDGPVLILDLDGDGAADLLQTRGGTRRTPKPDDYQPVLYRNPENRGPTRDPEALPPLSLSVGAVVAADFDGNGWVDVFLGGRIQPGQYPSPPRSVLLLNRRGRFEDRTEAMAPDLRAIGMVTSALTSDIDGDGWIDLLVALEWGGVRVFRNQEGKALVDATTTFGFDAVGAGWWTSLAAGEFNGDGRPDFVAGNLGLNTPYRAPAILYVGRFAAGAPQLIEAYLEGDRLYPRRNLRTLSGRIPTIKRRFPTNNAYAEATLGEILGEERLAAAERLEADELRSGVFLSGADRRYAFRPLPRIAQIAPLQGVVTADVNGDGHTDILAVQNSFAPIPAIGRFDGGVGQLLWGDGRGGFTPVPPAESGVVVPGDAKALVMLDLNRDGWPDFIASRNDATTMAWQNRGRPGGASFRVRLIGSAGNREGIGARLDLELADGRWLSRELPAGGGYYSQSEPGVFFGYPVDTPPRRLRVRWPSGPTTEHVFTAPPPAELLVEAP